MRTKELQILPTSKSRQNVAYHKFFLCVVQFNPEIHDKYTLLYTIQMMITTADQMDKVE